MTPSYIELHARSAFSFLRGASQPEQLVECAAELKYPAMALLDRDGVYGAPRFFARGREHQVRAITGAELTLDDGSVVPVLVASRTGYQNLCRLITRAKLRGTKQHAPVHWDEIAEFQRRPHRAHWGRGRSCPACARSG
jgi:error-prone DNA polymerase